jgi:hypothetical protein
MDNCTTETKRILLVELSRLSTILLDGVGGQYGEAAFFVQGAYWDADSNLKTFR